MANNKDRTSHHPVIHPCKDCGRQINTEVADYCTNCLFKHGEVFILDMSQPMEKWHWKREWRGD